MTFKEEEIETFRNIFLSKKSLITDMPGCHSAVLWQDLQNPCVFMTYSIWDDASCLENYRNSDLFKDVWKRTKPLFSAQAQAWSLEESA